MGLVRVGVSVAAALAKAGIEEYSRSQRAKDAYETAAARRAERGYDVGRRGEAQGDRDFDAIVNRHRRGLVGPLSDDVDGNNAVLGADDSEDEHVAALADVAAFAVADYYLDDEAVELGKSVLDGTIGAALAALPEDAGRNTQECMILGSVVRLVALLAQMTEQRLAATTTEGAGEEARIEVVVAGHGVDEVLLQQVREAVTTASHQVLASTDLVGAAIGQADNDPPGDAENGKVGVRSLRADPEDSRRAGKPSSAQLRAAFDKSLVEVKWDTSKGRPPDLMGVFYERG